MMSHTFIPLLKMLLKNIVGENVRRDGIFTINENSIPGAYQEVLKLH